MKIVTGAGYMIAIVLFNVMLFYSNVTFWRYLVWGKPKEQVWIILHFDSPIIREVAFGPQAQDLVTCNEVLPEVTPKLVADVRNDLRMRVVPFVRSECTDRDPLGEKAPVTETGSLPRGR